MIEKRYAWVLLSLRQGHGRSKSALFQRSLSKPIDAETLQDGMDRSKILIADDPAPLLKKAYHAVGKAKAERLHH